MIELFKSYIKDSNRTKILYLAENISCSILFSYIVFIKKYKSDILMTRAIVIWSSTDAEM